MDKFNLNILKCLQESGRISHSELSTRVGLSVPAVTERIKKLEANGTIKGYTALLDGKSLGKGITAFIRVQINNPKTYRKFALSVSQIKEVQECHHIVGEYDYLIKVKTKDTSSLENLISNHLRVIDGVGRTQTTVVLSSSQEGTYIELEDIVDRIKNGKKHA